MAKTSAIIFGIIFVIAGVWGFFSSSVFGLFAADTVSSIIHVIVGIILLVVASKPAARATLKTVGIIYIVFALLGFYSGVSVLGIFVTNGAANWLYIVLGVLMTVIGFSAKPKMEGMESSTPAPQI